MVEQIMNRYGIQIPQGHGSTAVEPPVSRWLALAQENLANAQTRSLSFCGQPLATLRKSLRFSWFPKHLDQQSTPWVITGHQPELFHPGIWFRYFLAEYHTQGAFRTELVVDSDKLRSLSFVYPHADTKGKPSLEVLCSTDQGTWAGQAPVPDPQTWQHQRLAITKNWQAYSGQPWVHHWEQFAAILDEVRPRVTSCAHWLTQARQLYQEKALAPWPTWYTSTFYKHPEFKAFIGEIIYQIESFHTLYNQSIDDLRQRHKIQSRSHPLPHLLTQGPWLELPFWILEGDSKERVWVLPSQQPQLRIGDTNPPVSLPSQSTEGWQRLEQLGWRWAPRAQSLTLFVRLFAADWFIHGMGGNNYEQVNNLLMERWLRITPPPYGVASLTWLLQPGREQIDLSNRWHTWHRNPHLSRLPSPCLSPKKHKQIIDLSLEKDSILHAKQGTSTPLSAAERHRIATLNQSMLAVVEPEYQQWLANKTTSMIWSQRNYPFCFFDPNELADCARALLQNKDKEKPLP
jgi:hypothetical protein